MRSFFDWYRDARPSHPWLVCGKGPTFSRRGEVELNKYNIFTLNHALRELKFAQVAHIIDVEVVESLGDVLERAEYVAMPVHPHVHFSPTDHPLSWFCERHPILGKLDDDGRLLAYHLSTKRSVATKDTPVVKVGLFSASVAVRLLAMAGAKKIRTIGVDGGVEYAKEFHDLRPFAGGHASFDCQFEEIGRTVAEFGIDFGKAIE